MFGEGDEPYDESDDEFFEGNSPYDGLFGGDPAGDDPFGNIDENSRVMDWGELESGTRTDIQDSADHDICDHDDKEVVTEMVSGGATAMGFGVNGGRSVSVVVCKTCPDKWVLN